MVETIAPVVHGARRGSYGVSVVAHTLGAVISAVVVGAALGGIGHLLGAPWSPWGPLLVAGCAAVYAARDAFGLPVPVLDRGSQVPEWWRTFFTPSTAAFLYGIGLGSGFFTFLTFGTFVAVATAALVSGSPLLGAVLCGPFGLARALAVALAHTATGTSEPAEIVDRLESLASTRLPGVINAAVLGGLGVLALASLF
jgi:hypothetical protein